MQEFYVQITKNKERFWVKVLGKKGQVWHGIVDNDLINTDIQLGDKIKFKKKDIFDFDLF
jgi:uncharacterized protein YegJ (DUF2314 family)